MQRRPSTQDISWILDLDRNNQLDLNPPYQRRSVWSPKDRRYFVDTIFRNFPSPAIFLHKSISPSGEVKYFVIDGKQRIETILLFTKGKLRVSPDYGDARLNNKKFSEISETELKSTFWNYQVPVEMIDFSELELVNNVFDRLNRNSRKLTNQELRHAKYDGWFINFAERKAELPIWKTLGVASAAREKRMMDVQFISELMLANLKSGPCGFSQDDLDQAYADYEELGDLENFDSEQFESRFDAVLGEVTAIEKQNNVTSGKARGVGHLYSLWVVLADSNADRDIQLIGQKYEDFMSQVNALAALDATADFSGFSEDVRKYRDNSRGASTEASQRQARHEALKAGLGL